MLWTGAALILIGIVLALLPFHITMDFFVVRNLEA